MGQYHLLPSLRGPEVRISDITPDKRASRILTCPPHMFSDSGRDAGFAGVIQKLENAVASTIRGTALSPHRSKTEVRGHRQMA
jgi:hypothetical protein